jgi:hypothetical protein
MRGRNKAKTERWLEYESFYEIIFNDDI